MQINADLHWIFNVTLRLHYVYNIHTLFILYFYIIISVILQELYNDATLTK